MKNKLENVVAVTNRQICQGDFMEQVEYLCQNGIKTIILREKDVTLEEYILMAGQVLDIAEKYKTAVILHSFVEAAENLNFRHIHLSMEAFRKNMDKLKNYETVGVSTHTVEEGMEAEKSGASYITASHIYETECKPGIPPRGLVYLKKVCENIHIPVYALGGINFKNMNEPMACGASKVCMMSELMNRF